MQRAYIIAEIGNTHEGSLGLAKRFIKVAAECGVDCVKFQTHIFEAESLLTAPNPPYFKDETRKDYFERTAFDIDQYIELKRFAEQECGCDFISSPFSLEAVDLLEAVGVSAYKIPSGEVTNYSLLRKVAKTGKKVILSSGMSTWAELDEAVSTIKNNGCSDLVVLQCTSKYPCPPEKAGLNVIEEMKKRYDVPIGFSDHTLGLAVPLAAYLKGAVIIEKHFTLSKEMYGSDAINSTEPTEFRELVSNLRDMESALTNDIDKDAEAKELEHMKFVFEKSVVSVVDIPKNTIIEECMLSIKKPGDGIPAKYMDKIIGMRTVEHISVDSALNTKQIENLILD